MIRLINDSDKADAHSLAHLREAADSGQMPGLHPMHPSEQQQALDEMFADPNFQEIDSILVVRGHRPDLHNAEILAIQSDTGEPGVLVFIPYGPDAALQYLSIDDESDAAGRVYNGDSVTFFQTGEPDREILIPQQSEQAVILDKLRSTEAFRELERAMGHAGLAIADDNVEVALDPESNRGAVLVTSQADALREAFGTAHSSQSPSTALIDFEIDADGQPVNTRFTAPYALREPIDFPPNDTTPGDLPPPEEEPEDEDAEVMALLECVQDCVQDLTAPSRPIMTSAILFCLESCKACALIKFLPVCIPCLGCLAVAGVGAGACAASCIFGGSTAAAGGGTRLTPA